MRTGEGIALPLDGSAALRGQYRLTRFLFLRALGFVYCVAFLSLAQQLLPLLGAHGLLPARPYLARVGGAAGGGLSAFLTLPTVFWLSCADIVLAACAWAGLALSLVVLAGFANALLLATLWFLYLSFVHIGQLFYGYGWEILLLETGFLAVFLCPLVEPRPFAPQPAPATAVLWLLRWVLFRVMFGAGLIKLRGDSCWRDLTCLLYHYETQPLPNPLSWYVHQLPLWFERIEVLFNHVVELAAPWLLFLPRPLRHAGALSIVVFQVLLILTGNLSWLNWLTITLCIAAFDDAALARILPPRLRRRLLAVDWRPLPPPRRAVTVGLVALVAWLSIGPVRNLLGAHQLMNSSFGPFELVNTYGAFGSVTRERHAIILEGTSDPVPGAQAHWREYEFECAPGDLDRRPCVVAPYQYRVDWQIWFAAMEDPAENAWLVHLIYQLLQGDRGALSLMGSNPFPNAPPRFLRAELYVYRFTRCGEHTRAWWRRDYLGSYLPPLSLDDPRLQRFIDSYGWRSGR